MTFCCCFVYGLISFFVHSSAAVSISNTTDFVQVKVRWHASSDSVICGWRRDRTSVLPDMFCYFLRRLCTSSLPTVSEGCLFQEFVIFFKPVRAIANGQIRCYSAHDCGTENPNDIQMFPITQPQPSVCLCYYSNAVILQVQKHTEIDDCLHAVNLEVISFIWCSKCVCRCREYRIMPIYSWSVYTQA